MVNYSPPKRRGETKKQSYLSNNPFHFISLFSRISKSCLIQTLFRLICGLEKAAHTTSFPLYKPLLILILSRQSNSWQLSSLLEVINMIMNVENNMGVVVRVREFDPNTDGLSVEQVESRCEVGPSGKLCLFTDLLGDPICRVRHSPAFLMLVLMPCTLYSLLVFSIVLFFSIFPSFHRP